MSFNLSEYVVRVLAYDGATWRWASGCCIGDDDDGRALVLTTKHKLFDDAAFVPQTIIVISQGVETEATGLSPEPWDPYDLVLLRVRLPTPKPATLSLEGLEHAPAYRAAGFAVAGTQSDGCTNLTDFGGTLRPGDARMTALVGLEITAPPEAEDWAGASGGPVFVNEKLVGIIKEVPRAFKGGRIDAIALHRIQHATATPLLAALAALKPQVTTRLPWEDVFISALQKLALEEQKTCAEHAGILPIEGPDLAERIARRMISEGILATARVLRQVRGAMDPKSFEELMRLAETLWVDSTSANHVAGIVGTADVAVLTTDQDWSARHHVERAYTVKNRGPKAWKSIVIDVAHEEPIPEAIVAQTRKALERALNATSPADIARRLVHQRPFVALIAGPPRTDVLDRLKTEWPDLNVIFMHSEPANTPVLGVRQIGPPPTRPDEDRAEQDKGDAWAMLL